MIFSLSFRAKCNVAKNLGSIHVCVTEILPPFGRLDDIDIRSMIS